MVGGQEDMIVDVALDLLKLSQSTMHNAPVTPEAAHCVDEH
jgi:hypothetical protein